MLTCSTCGADNPAASKFCHECGTSLARACTACGAALSASQRFCGECGTSQTAAAPVVAQAASAQAERRVCSVLFVDLVGFTPLSEARDAEEIRELLSQYFERARTIVERYGGVVEKFIGDAVMAIWGTPVAVEGDAERAVRAGLDLVVSVAELGELVGAPGLRARAGVVTGDVAVTVGVIGEGVAGDTVNTAARVQTAAGPGTVWVDDVTERITHAAIGYVDAGEHVLKGKAEPMHLWTATRVLSTVGGAQRVDGLEAPMLGRDADLRAVKDLFHSAIERSTARLVVVTGPAGIGKSRLGWEFEKYIDGLAEVVNWHRGRCLSYGDGVAFWALAEAVRQRFGIAEEDPLDVGAAKLVEGIRRFVPDPVEQAYVGPRLARLLGVAYAAGDTGDAAALPRAELFAGWRLFLERLAAEAPVVLVLEDTQHADAGLLDFLDHLVDWSRNAAIFVLAFARTELAERQPGWGTGRNRTTITLETLSDPAMDTLVDTLVPGMPAATRAAVAAQAQGIPLYAVETIRSLIDRDIVVPREGVYHLVGDVSDLAVPDTLRGLLAARYDALPPALHTLLGDAAVLGTNFPPEALVAVSGRDESEVRAALDELLRREILDVSADPLSPQRGFYGFSQNLLRQVVYDTLSRRDRKARHLAVAAHLRSAFAGDGDEVIEVVAQHYVDALTAVPTDDDVEALTAVAIDALTRAADRATRAGAPRGAAGLLAMAAGLAERRDDLRAATLWEGAAQSALIGALYPDAVTYSRAASAAHTAQGDRRGAARAQVTTGTALARQGHHDDGRLELETAVSALRDPADRDTVLALTELAGVGTRDARLEQATECAHEAILLAQAVGVDRNLLAHAFTSQGLAYLFTNRTQEAMAVFEHSIRLVEREAASAELARARLNLGDLLLTNDAERALTVSQQSYANSRRVGDYSNAVISACNVAAALLWLGRWDEANQLFEQVVQDGMADESDLLQTEAFLAALRGDDARLAAMPPLPGLDSPDIQDVSYARMVEMAVATTAADNARALEIARAGFENSFVLGYRHETFVWCWTLALLAAREDGDPAAATELVALLDAQPDGYLAPLPVATRALARAVDGGSIPAAREALAAFRDVGSPFHLANALLDLAAFDPDSARPYVDEAAAINTNLRAAVLTRRLAQIDLSVAASG